MKHFYLFITAALALSTYFQANASFNQEPLSKLGLEGIYVIVDEDYLNNETNEYSLSTQISDTLESNNISKQNPLYIIIGKGIADNQDAFDKLIVYLNRTHLKSIILSLEDNVKNNITHLKSDFLVDCKLTSFASNGFKNVRLIEDNFLRNNKITFFSAEDFKNLKQIGDSFLAYNRLTSFSTQGLEKVIVIGAGFLAMNNNLKSVDLRALKSVIHIEDKFLAFCPNIQEIIVSKEKEEFFKKHIPDEHEYKVVVK